MHIKRRTGPRVDPYDTSHFICGKSTINHLYIQYTFKP